MTSRTPSVLVRQGLLAALVSCSSNQEANVAASLEPDRGMSRAAVSDGARCEFEGRSDREVVESVSTGAIQPSIRRVYRVVGEGEKRRRILACREVDTNLDGAKDLVRRYDDQGQASEEEADSNYDGTFDTFIRFGRGRIAQVEVDLDDDGKRDETRYYLKGKLSRIQRDTNADGDPDVWEIYADGHLERMGEDLDFDGRVDRWNRDEVSARKQEQAELDALRSRQESPPETSDDAPGAAQDPPAPASAP